MAEMTKLDRAVAADSGQKFVAWVLSYFAEGQSLAADSLHLAYSIDGLHWLGLAGGSPVYQLSGFGTNHIRDPYILRKQDGTFVYLATDWTLAENDENYWQRPSSHIFVAESRDLITFTEPRLLRVSNLRGPDGTAMHAWAPEAYFDARENRYAIAWSGNDASGTNHIYVSFTTDFRTLLNPTPDVLFAPGYSVIDATLVSHDGQRYLFYKDETGSDVELGAGPGKDVQVARSTGSALLPGAFSRLSPSYLTRGANQSVRRSTEAPFVIQSPTGDRWYLFADFYTLGGSYGCWQSPSLAADPVTWTELAANEYRFPAGIRHAHALRVTRAELAALIAHYGSEG